METWPIKLAGKSATIEAVYHPSGPLAAAKVELLVDGEVQRAAQFRTWRGAQRVVDNWFKV